MVLANIW